MYYPGFNWFNPSVEDLRKKMRFAFENFKKLKEEALKSSEYIRKEWCWAKTQEAVIRRIEEVYKTRWGRYGDRFEKD
jgi:hypothetical protein